MGKTVLLRLRKGDKGVLEKLLRTEKDARMWKRYQSMLLCSKKPRKEVAEQVGMTPRNLEYLMTAYGKEGIGGLRYKTPPGRPSRLSKRKQERIISIIESNPQGWDTKHIWEIITKKGGITYTKRHIYRIAQKWGFAEVVPRTKSRRQNEIEVKKFKKSKTNNQRNTERLGDRLRGRANPLLRFHIKESMDTQRPEADKDGHWLEKKGLCVGRGYKGKETGFCYN